MRNLQKKVTAAFALTVLGLCSLPACQGNAPQAKETPKPTQTTPSPTRTTESPTPSPTPEPFEFEYTDNQGYLYAIKIDTNSLPKYTAVVDTAKGPPGYVMVAIEASSMSVPVYITNKSSGGKEAPRPSVGMEITPIWEEQLNENCINSDQEEIRTSKSALCAWDWKKYNLHQEYGVERWTDEYPQDRLGYTAIVGDEDRLAINWYYDGDDTWKRPTHKGLHGDPFGRSDRRKTGFEVMTYDAYVVKEDQLNAFTQTMLHPDGFQVTFFANYQQHSMLLGGWETEEVKGIIPYAPPSGTLVKNESIPSVYR